MRRPRILTWHVHGAYLEALAHADVDWLVPVRSGRPTGYGGVPASLAGHPRLHDIAADDVHGLHLDGVLFQSRANWLVDQHEILTAAQRRLPRIFLEHDPPREHPTDTRHPVDDPDVLLVHVTHFNALMWDAGRTPVRVIEHGVSVPDGIDHRGDLERGIVVVNDLATRGRRLGRDLVEAAREVVPLDLVGLRSEALGGLGNIPHDALPGRLADYRFCFHPARYTSLGLAVIEAMLVGTPIVALATTEMPTVLEDGRSGVISTDPARLVEGMQALLADPGLARRLGAAGREVARRRFGIDRFARDWEAVIREVTGVRSGAATTIAVPAGAAR